MHDLRISLNTAEIDEAELERLHRRLRTYLDDAGLDQVDSVRSTESPDGSRGIGAVLLGVFEAALPKAVTAAAGRLSRVLSEFTNRSKCGVTVEINGNKLVIEQAQPDQTERILALFENSVGASQDEEV